MTVDGQYTNKDHEFRDDDSYAQVKYSWTLRILGKLKIGPNDKLVNAGCGFGDFSNLAAQEGYQVIAFEPDENTYKGALIKKDPRVVMTHQDLFHFKNNHEARCVVMHDVLEHIEDEAATIKKLADLLQDQGILILSVPAIPGLFGFHDEQLGHFRRYSKRTLNKALSSSFDVIKIRYLGLSTIPVVYWFSKAKRKPYPIEAVGKKTIVGKIFLGMCKLEGLIPTPIGTSLLVVARKK